MAHPSHSILVTGGAGFLGSHLGQALLRRGTRLAVVDRFGPDYAPPWKQANLEALRRAGEFAFFPAELTDPAALRAAFARARPEAVVHLAARADVRRSVADPHTYNEANVTGTLHLLELCREFGVPKLVFGSTITVYGAAPAPFREDRPHLAPLSPYATTKLAAEVYCRAYARLFGLQVLCLRLATLYGPRLHRDVSVHRFLADVTAGRALPLAGDGSLARDYLYVDDAVAGILAALDYTPAGAPPSEIFNLGSGRPTTLRELIAAIERATGLTAVIEQRPANPADPPAAWADISRATERLGFRPATSLEQGLAAFLAWYRAAGQSAGG